MSYFRQSPLLRRFASKARTINSTSKRFASRSKWYVSGLGEEQELVPTDMHPGKEESDKFKPFKQSAEDVFADAQSTRDSEITLLTSPGKFDYRDLKANREADRLLSKGNDASDGNIHLRGQSSGGHTRRSLENFSNPELMADPNAPEKGSFSEFAKEAVTGTAINVASGQLGKLAKQGTDLASAAVEHSSGSVGTAVTAESDTDLVVGLLGSAVAIAAGAAAGAVAAPVAATAGAAYITGLAVGTAISVGYAGYKQITKNTFNTTHNVRAAFDGYFSDECPDPNSPKLSEEERQAMEDLLFPKGVVNLGAAVQSLGIDPLINPTGSTPNIVRDLEAEKHLANLGRNGFTCPLQSGGVITFTVDSNSKSENPMTGFLINPGEGGDNGGEAPIPGQDPSVQFGGQSNMILA